MPRSHSCDSRSRCSRCGVGLALGGGRAGGHLLEGQAQDLLGVGHDRQAVVLQEPPTLAIAHRAGPRQGVVGGEVQLGGVMEDQDGGVGLLHLGPRQFEVGGGDGGVGDFGPVAEAIDGAEGVPGEVRRQRALGLLGESFGGVDEPSGASFVPQFGRGEIRFGPGTWVRERRGCHGHRSVS